MNLTGQLGDGSATFSNFPVDVMGISTAVDLSAGYDPSCAMLQEGGVVCWGSN